MTGGPSPQGVPSAGARPDLPGAEPRSPLDDDRDEAADRAARPLMPDGRRARAPQPGRLSAGRALAGAGVSVAGVVLGIGTLLWISDDPSTGPGPVVSAPSAGDDTQVAVDPYASQPEAESSPVDPPAVALPSPVAAVPPSPPAAVAAPPPPPAPAPPGLTVLNNSRIAGLADTAAATFSGGGWPVAVTGNFTGRIRSTTVYYEAGQEAAARELAARFAAIQRVLPRFEGLPGDGLTVVVTRDFV